MISILEIPIAGENSLLEAGSAIRDVFVSNDTASVSFTVSVPDAVTSEYEEDSLNDEILLETHATATAIAEDRTLRRRQNRKRGKSKGGNQYQSGGGTGTGGQNGSSGRDNQGMTWEPYPELRECIQSVLNEERFLKNEEQDISVTLDQVLGIRHLLEGHLHEGEDPRILQTCDTEITNEMQGKVRENASTGRGLSTIRTSITSHNSIVFFVSTDQRLFRYRRTRRYLHRARERVPISCPTTK